MKHFLTLVALVPALAFAWQPTKPVTVIFPNGPGAGNEISFRIVADQIEKEFPKPGSVSFNTIYNNPIEIKQAGNHWDKFPPMTYKAFFYLSSADFTNFLEQIMLNKKNHNIVFNKNIN